MELEYVRPEDIERRSFAIIEEELGREAPEPLRSVLFRLIHTTADFSYADTLHCPPEVIPYALSLLVPGTTIVTDTNMVLSGINKSALQRCGCKAVCYMADEEVARLARERGTTRASACVDRAAALSGNVIYVVGNAPTALVRLCEHMKEGTFRPALVIGMPVGFVNVVASKEGIIESGVPCIVNRGRKGGSNVAAACCNALLYLKGGR